MRQTFHSVWDALTDTPEESASMKARSELMMVVVQAIERWNVTQKAAGDRLGITQPQVNDLLSGRISRFNMKTLQDLASKVRPTKAPRTTR